MSCFDEDPQDEVESYQCHECRAGTVSQNMITGDWECSNCEFKAESDIQQ